jgi:hypothetical protein
VILYQCDVRYIAKQNTKREVGTSPGERASGVGLGRSAARAGEARPAGGTAQAGGGGGGGRACGLFRAGGGRLSSVEGSIEAEAEAANLVSSLLNRRPDGEKASLAAPRRPPASILPGKSECAAAGRVS